MTEGFDLAGKSKIDLPRPPLAMARGCGRGLPLVAPFGSLSAGAIEKAPFHGAFSMAEREGFEPSREIAPP